MIRVAPSWSLGLAGLAPALALAGSVSVPHSTRVLDADGTPLNGDLPVTVTIYDDAAGTNPVFSQDFGLTPVEDGYFTVLLTTDTGTTVALDASVFAGGPRWVGTTVGSTTVDPTLIGTPPGVAGQLPTTTAPPTPCAAGALAFDTDRGANGSLVVCDNAGGWVSAQASDFSAIGGAVTSTATHKIHTFTSSSTFQITQGTALIDVLVVGGGGGGGKYWSAGGGGGGGVVYTSGLSVGPGSYTVTVGTGGTGSTNYNSGRGNAANGQDSAFGTIIGLGGGYGASYPGCAPCLTHGGNGGSGGGAANHDNQASGNGGTATQPGSGSGGFGNNGGTSANGGGGGGGGAGGAGSNGISQNGGDAGDGRSYDITGTAAYYGGGGGGAGGTPGTGGLGGGGNGSAWPTEGNDGQTNTGGGGGGGGNGTNNSVGGGDGGSGVVIVRYPI